LFLLTILFQDWHKKNNWGGFTFDEHLFPYPSDTLGILHVRVLFHLLSLGDYGFFNVQVLYLFIASRFISCRTWVCILRPTFMMTTASGQSRGPLFISYY
jgi:hypothetical protein